MEFKTHLQLAVDYCGSQKALADKIGITQPGVSFLLHEAKNISAELAIAIERATDCMVTRGDLRPDIFGPAPSKSVEAA